jgi:hypothetical protein
MPIPQQWAEDFTAEIFLSVLECVLEFYLFIYSELPPF